MRKAVSVFASTVAEDVGSSPTPSLINVRTRFSLGSRCERCKDGGRIGAPRHTSPGHPFKLRIVRFGKKGSQLFAWIVAEDLGSWPTPSVINVGT